RRIAITPAADVWALGLIAFRALTGRYFWRTADGEGASFAMILREVVFDLIPSASARAAEYGVAHLIPPGFDAWFARGGVRDPAARLEHAGLAREALGEMIGGAPTVPASPASFVPPHTAPGAPRQPTPVGAAQTQPARVLPPPGPLPPQP